MAVSILALSASPCSAALSKGEPLAKPYTSQLNRKLYRHAKASPFDRFPPVGGRCRASDRKGNEVDANAVSLRGFSYLSYIYHLFIDNKPHFAVN